MKKIYFLFITAFIVTNSFAQLSGSYTINPDIPVSATNYQTWATAFSALNTQGVSAATTFTVTGVAATITFAEGNLLLGGAYVGGVAQSALLTTLSATNTLSFTAGAGKTINMSGVGVGIIDYVFRLQGVDYVTFDGINIVDVGVSNATWFEFGYVIGNASNNDGAGNNTIKNFSCTLNKLNTSIGNGPYGVVVGNGITIITFGVAGSYASRNNNNKIQNFTIQNVKRGIQFDGLAIPAFDEGNQVSGPAFTSAAAGVWTGGSRITNFGAATAGTDYAIGIDGQKSLKVFNVQIDGGNETTAGTAISGIHFGTAASTCDGADNVEIYNCVIRNMDNTNALPTAGVAGIRATAATLHTLKIYNNVIYDLRNLGSAAGNLLMAFQFNGPTTQSKIELYYNSVNISSVHTNAAGVARGFIASVTPLIVVVKNNIFQVTGGGSTGGARAVEFTVASTLIDFTNNVYNVGVTSASRVVGVYSAVLRQNLIDWQSTMATTNGASDGIDQRSAYGAPGFVSNTDLTYGAANNVDNSGVPITGLSVSTDILGVTRNVNTPDIGAFEGNFSAGFVDQASPGIAITPFEPLGSVSAEVRAVITDNVNSVGNLTVRLWYRLGVAGAFTALPPDVAPGTANNGEYRWGISLRALAAGTYQYYIVARDAAATNNYFADPTMAPAAVSPGFASAPDPNWAGANPFPSAGIRTFQNAGLVLAGGTYTVGVGGGETYPSLTAVALELSQKPISGNVIFELTTNYTGAGEVYPIVFNQPAYTVAGPLTITIRPAASVAAELLTAGDPGIANSLILLDGMRDLTIDGRPGGTGATRMWRFRNTRDELAVTNIGSAFLLQNDAIRNTLKYLNVESNSGATGKLGVISIGSTFYGGQGNNLNTIDNCEIKNNTTAALAFPPNPIRGIYCLGATNALNKTNTFSNNLVHDFFNAGISNSIGISLSGEIGSTITGNSIYQTAPRAVLALFSLGISVGAATGPGVTITNNYIGGTAPLCAGTAMTITGTTSAVFYGMQVNVGSFTTPSLINGNTITNLNLTTANVTAGSVVALGINLTTGSNQVAVAVTNNTIGNSTVDATVSPAITLTSTSTGAPSSFAGYFASAGAVLNISNNSVGGVKLLTTAAGTTGFIGIQQQTAGTGVNIDNNLIGSLATANNIVQSTNAGISGIVQISTILSNTSISNNTVANVLFNAALGGAAQFFTGISAAGVAPLTINGNTVRDVVGNNHAQVTGISMTSAGIGTSITNNTIRNFTINPQVPATGIPVVGMITSASISTGVIQKNTISNLINGSTNVGSTLYGITNQFGTNWTYSNNMVSLGSGTTGDIIIYGINDFSSPPVAGAAKYYFNTVNITGAAAAGVTNTYAFLNSDGTGVGLKTFQNNIFANTRTSGTGIGFAVGHNVAGILPVNIASNYNDLISAGAIVAQWQGTLPVNNLTFAAWQAATVGDVNSVSIAPVFVSANDAHLDPSLNGAINNLGTTIAGITTDIDGNTRNLTTPDMGADEFMPTGFASWIGGFSTLWSTANNWEASFVPIPPTNVSVPTVAPFMPQLQANTTINNLAMQTGTLLDLNGKIFTINGTVTQTGTAVFKGSSTSNLYLNGAAGTVNFDQTSAATRSLSGLVLSGGSATLGTGALNIYGIISLAAGASLNMADQPVTLKSTANGALGTASISDLTGCTMSNANKLTVERYIDNPQRSWHLLSGKGVYGPQTIFNSWQQGGAVVANKGTWITSTLFTGANGFDATNMNLSSIITHNQGGGGGPSWNYTLANTNTTTVSSFQGYMLFVRGDRTCLPSNALVTSTVLSRTDTLVQGLQSVFISSTGTGRTLVGNPYPSPIDMETVFATTTNLAQDMYIWDPSLTGNYGVGGFRLVQRTAPGVYQQTPVVLGGGPFPDATARYIHSGQAFFLRTTGTAGITDATVNFIENYKVSTVSVVNPIVPTVGDQQLITNLLIRNTDNVVSLADGIRVRFDRNYSAGITDDIEKMANFAENISSYRGGKKLIVEKRPMIQSVDTIFLRITNAGIKDYRLQLGTIDFVQTELPAMLEDNYLHTTTKIDLQGSVTNYDFSVTADPASSATDRFMIVFGKGKIDVPVVITGTKGISVYPNPVTNKMLTLQFNDMVKGIYQLRLINTVGQVVMTQQVSHNGGSSTQMIGLDKNATNGNYRLEIIKPDNSRVMKALVIIDN